MLPEQFNQLNNRLDKIEHKLDDYLETSKVNQTDISWLKGSMKTAVTLITTIISGVAVACLQLWLKLNK